MNKRNNVDERASNDELARRLFQRDRQTQPPEEGSGPQAPAHEPLASRRDPGVSAQSWSLGRSADSISQPVSERERRALFAALSKGTKANLGRDASLAELVRLVEEVNRARALISSSQDAIMGTLCVYFDGQSLTFRGSMQQLIQRGDAVARRDIA